MSRCVDYPCCGHEAGGCPDPQGRVPCARCGGPLPKRATSAVCARCHAYWRRKWPEGEDDLADRADGDLALRDAPAEPREILGSELHPDDQRHVLAAWCHRYTREHKPEWAGCLRPDGVAYRVQFASDADWLAHTWFQVTAGGRLDLTAKECRSEPTWPDGAPEYPKQAQALRDGPAAAPPRASQPHEVGGARVETWGGGRYGSVAWYGTVEAAEEYAGWLTRYGYWQGKPPRVVKSGALGVR